MIGSARDDEFGKLQKPAAELGGNTQRAYVIVAGVDAVCQSACQAGADILMEPRDEDHGGRSCAFRDPEGQLWNLGTYDPWSNMFAPG